MWSGKQDPFSRKTLIADRAVALHVIEANPEWNTVIELAPELLTVDFMKSASKINLNYFSNHVRGPLRRQVTCALIADRETFPTLTADFYKTLEPALQTDLEVVIATITRWPELYQTLPETVQHQPQVLMVLLKTGMRLESGYLLNAVVKHPLNYLILKPHANRLHLSDQLFAEKTVVAYPHIHKVLAPEIKENKEIVTALLEAHPQTKKYLPQIPVPTPTPTPTPTVGQ